VGGPGIRTPREANRLGRDSTILPGITTALEGEGIKFLPQELPVFADD